MCLHPVMSLSIRCQPLQFIKQLNLVISKLSKLILRGDRTQRGKLFKNISGQRGTLKIKVRIIFCPPLLAQGMISPGIPVMYLVSNQPSYGCYLNGILPKGVNGQICLFFLVHQISNECVIIQGRGFDGIPEIPCTQNFPLSNIADYIFALNSMSLPFPLPPVVNNDHSLTIVQQESI